MPLTTRGAAALLAAVVAGALSWSLLSVVLPAPVTDPRPGPVLESVTPAQLAAMGVRLDPALQPVELPEWLSGIGARLPSSVLLAGDAETAVRRSTGGVRSVSERSLGYATLGEKAIRARGHGPTVFHRLVWALVGTRAAAGSVGAVEGVLWLVDARTGHELTELAVLAPPPGGGAPPIASGPGP